MVPKQSFPPTHHHLSLATVLPPSTAQTHLSTFLTRTQSNPHLHPDSLLSTAGITYSAHSGPSGGLALHHLRRIDAGLRGEDLLKETEEELARFAEVELPEGDDARLDAVIGKSGEGGKGAGGLKRKRERSMQDINDWAEESSSRAAGAPQQELESFANTPMHVQDWREQEEYERGQSVLEGEVGEREGAPVVRQNGALPAVVTEGEDGDGAVRKPKTAAEREARKAAKKAKRTEAKKAKAKAEGKG